MLQDPSLWLFKFPFHEQMKHFILYDFPTMAVIPFHLSGTRDDGERMRAWDHWQPALSTQENTFTFTLLAFLLRRIITLRAVITGLLLPGAVETGDKLGTPAHRICSSQLCVAAAEPLMLSMSVRFEDAARACVQPHALLRKELLVWHLQRGAVTLRAGHGELPLHQESVYGRSCKDMGPVPARGQLGQPPDEKLLQPLRRALQQRARSCSTGSLTEKPRPWVNCRNYVFRPCYPSANKPLESYCMSSQAGSSGLGGFPVCCHRHSLACGGGWSTTEPIKPAATGKMHEMSFC